MPTFIPPTRRATQTTVRFQLPAELVADSYDFADGGAVLDCLDHEIGHIRTRDFEAKMRQVAVAQPRYIGKETSRRWEQGDDLSLVDFRCAEYGDGKTVADQELRQRIVEIGIRKTARATKTDSKTIMLISRGERVKPNTLLKVIEFVGKATRMKVKAKAS